MSAGEGSAVGQPTPQEERLVTTTIEAYAAFEGPLPPPQMLDRYNSVIPDGANRIMIMAEKQQIHRHELESTVVTANAAAQARGQLFAFLLALVAIIGGVFLIATGKDTAGLAAILTALGALVTVFIVGRVQATSERRSKRKEMANQVNRSVENSENRGMRIHSRPE